MLKPIQGQCWRLMMQAITRTGPAGHLTRKQCGGPASLGVRGIRASRTCKHRTMRLCVQIISAALDRVLMSIAPHSLTSHRLSSALSSDGAPCCSSEKQPSGQRRSMIAPDLMACMQSRQAAVPQPHLLA